jgi:hypothetical protein
MQQNDNFDINEDAVKDKIEMSPIEKYIRFSTKLHPQKIC